MAKPSSPALWIHPIPISFVLLSYVVVQQWALLGGILFITWTLIYLITDRAESWITTGPLLPLGILVLLNWKYSPALKTRQWSPNDELAVTIRR